MYNQPGASNPAARHNNLHSETLKTSQHLHTSGHSGPAQLLALHIEAVMHCWQSYHLVT